MDNKIIFYANKPKKRSTFLVLWNLLSYLLLTFFVCTILYNIYQSLLETQKQFSEIDYYKDKEIPEAEKYENVYQNNKSSVFIKSFPPDYYISPEEKETVNAQIGKLKDGGKKDQMIRIVEALKKDYPEGYFIVMKAILLAPNNLPSIVDMILKNEDVSDQALLFVHEFSHFGQMPCFFEKRKCPIYKVKYKAGKNDGENKRSAYSIMLISYGSDASKAGYWIEDKSMSINMDSLDEKKIVSGKKVYSYVKNYLQSKNNPEIDAEVVKLYLDDENTSIKTALDEVVSYTKSLRYERALAYQEKDNEEKYILHQTLLANSGGDLESMVYVTSLYLKATKEKFPASWNYLVKNRAFAYLLMKSVKSAEDDIGFAREEIKAMGKYPALKFADKLTMKPTPKEYKEDRAVLDLYFSEAGVKDLLGKDLTIKDLNAMGITVSKY